MASLNEHIEAELYEEITWRAERAWRNLDAQTEAAAATLQKAAAEGLRVTSFDADAVCKLAGYQARAEAWQRVADKLDNGKSVRDALAGTQTALLGTVRPGNSTGHGHRAFDTEGCEGTLVALREMGEILDRIS